MAHFLTTHLHFVFAIVFSTTPCVHTKMHHKYCVQPETKDDIRFALLQTNHRASNKQINLNFPRVSLDLSFPACSRAVGPPTHTMAFSLSDALTSMYIALRGARALSFTPATMSTPFSVTVGSDVVVSTPTPSRAQAPAPVAAASSSSSDSSERSATSKAAPAKKAESSSPQVCSLPKAPAKQTESASPQLCAMKAPAKKIQSQKSKPSEVSTKENRQPLGELNVQRVSNIDASTSSSKSGGKADLVEKVQKTEKIVVSQKKLDIQYDKEHEELLKENPNRFVMFPLKHHDIWKMYKSHMGTFCHCFVFCFCVFGNVFGINSH